MKYYSICDTALLFFQNYLSNHKQYVEIEEIKSEILPIAVGVPQGSMVRLMLFIVYINDFSKASSIFKFIMYANDTMLFSNLTSFSDNVQLNI